MARDIAKTDAYLTSKRERKIEMLFAHLKRILQLGRLRLRGPNGARDEFHLAATAQNLRKLAKLRTPVMVIALTQTTQPSSRTSPRNSATKFDSFPADSNQTESAHCSRTRVEAIHAKADVQARRAAPPLGGATATTMS